MKQARDDLARPAGGLLTAGDPAPASLENAEGQGGFLLIGDHAGRAIPAALGDLGLAPEQFERHIASDIGSLSLARELAHHLDSPLVHQAYSRLVIDCNREPGSAGSAPEVSDATTIPANQTLDPATARARQAEIFEPYHRLIASRIDQALAAGRRPILLAVHSFTPRLRDGAPRPWRFGVVHDGASPFSLAMLDALRERFGQAAVGDNQPYGMDGIDFTIPHHAMRRGLDYLELETRQDLIAEPAQAAQVAQALAPAIMAALASLSAESGRDR